jgi:hypothetical protein
MKKDYPKKIGELRNPSGLSAAPVQIARMIVIASRRNDMEIKRAGQRYV